MSQFCQETSPIARISMRSEHKTRIECAFIKEYSPFDTGCSRPQTSPKELSDKVIGTTASRAEALCQVLRLNDRFGPVADIRQRPVTGSQTSPNHRSSWYCQISICFDDAIASRPSTLSPCSCKADNAAHCSRSMMGVNGKQLTKF